MRKRDRFPKRKVLSMKSFKKRINKSRVRKPGSEGDTYRKKAALRHLRRPRALRRAQLARTLATVMAEDAAANAIDDEDQKLPYEEVARALRQLAGAETRRASLYQLTTVADARARYDERVGTAIGIGGAVQKHALAREATRRHTVLERLFVDAPETEQAANTADDSPPRSWFQRVRAWIATRVEAAADALNARGVPWYVPMILSTMLTLIASGLVADGYIQFGGAILAGALVWELLDGTNARGGLTAVRNVFLDYCIDRLGDIALFSALAYVSWDSQRWVGILAMAALVLVLVGSFVRAQAEALGLFTARSTVGRGERLIVLAVALIAGSVAVAVCCVVVLALLSIIQRVVGALDQDADGQESAVTERAWEVGVLTPRRRSADRR